METDRSQINRFQRWLKKKNDSIEEKTVSMDEVSSVENSDTKDKHSQAHSTQQLEQTPQSSPVENQSTDNQSIEKKPNIDTATLAHVFKEGFSKQDKKQQLRDLFHSGAFSDIDPLDSYNQDYTLVKSLSKDVADTLRSWHKRVEEVIEDFDQNEEQTIKEEEIESLTTETEQETSITQQNIEQDIQSNTSAEFEKKHK